MAAEADTPVWEQRFRAPTRTFPHWSRHAPDSLVHVSDEEGSYQTYAWDLATGERRRLSDEAVGVEFATVSADGREAIWFSDPTGDESGRWVAMPVGGGAARDQIGRAHV